MTKEELTKDDIIELAREAGLLSEDEAWVSLHQEAMERFAELLEAKVRKECAELCRAEANGRSPLAFDALHECADLMMKGYEE
jgi:hypothetical protein